MHFIGNFILSISCEFYYDDVIVTSFINIKYRLHSISGRLFQLQRNGRRLSSARYDQLCGRCRPKAVSQFNHGDELNQISQVLHWQRSRTDNDVSAHTTCIESTLGLVANAG